MAQQDTDQQHVGVLPVDDEGFVVDTEDCEERELAHRERGTVAPDHGRRQPGAAQGVQGRHRVRRRAGAADRRHVRQPAGRRGRGPGREPDRRRPEGLRLRLPGRRRQAAHRCGLQPEARRAARRARRSGRLATRAACRCPTAYALAGPPRLRRGRPGQDAKGNPIKVRGTGYFARCLQHETDHLYGYLYIDRLSKRDRKDALRQMAESDPRYPWSPTTDPPTRPGPALRRPAGPGRCGGRRSGWCPATVRTDGAGRRRCRSRCARRSRPPSRPSPPATRWASSTRWRRIQRYGVVPVSCWKRRAKVRGDMCARSASCSTVISSSRCRSIHTSTSPTVSHWRAGQRSLDVLGLAAVAVRRHHHPPGDLVGDLGPLLLADDVQAGVDAGGGAGRGDHRVLVDVQHVRFDHRPRVAAGPAPRRAASAPCSAARPAARPRRARRPRSTR